MSIQIKSKLFFTKSIGVQNKIFFFYQSLKKNKNK